MFDGDVGVAYCGIDDAAFGVALPDPGDRGGVLEPALRMDTPPCLPSTMLLERSVLGDVMPLAHRHGADDTGTKIALAWRTRFDYVDAPLVERGRPADQLSRSWAHVEGRRLLLERHADLYDRAPDAVRREAAARASYREGRKHLEERVRSPAAVAAFAGRPIMPPGP